MLPELGQITLILALLVSILQATLPLVGAQRGIAPWMAVARPAAYAQLGLVSLAFVVLTWAFVVQDFSVAYVAKNSNSLLPMMYRYSAVWGSHEGSLLLWALVLAIWTGAVALFSRGLPDVVMARVLGVMGVVAVGFLAFLIFTSNPFIRLLPSPGEGRDLNPLLQDPGMIIHPPLLYVGYVGFVVPFAFAIAALLDGHVDARWLRWTRPWTNIAWGFLTLGIALGSWWAYYELGWGGWWFWDPVENASFMPWLAGAALLHSAVVTERRKLQLEGLGGFEPGWFERGQAEILSGAAAGLRGMVKSDRVLCALRVVELWEEPGQAIAAGDQLRLLAGCDRRAETCRLKFDNFLNFRGFPNIPGQDAVLRYASQDGGHEGNVL